MTLSQITKHTFSTVLYAIVLGIILFFNNLGITWLLHHALFPLFEWFYDLSVFWKLFIILAGLTFVFTTILRFYKIIANIISTIISNIFLENWATLIISMIFCLSNLILITIQMITLWRWDFWLAIFWITIWFFVFQMNVIFIFKGKSSNYE
jgi:hypothetical protein